MKKYVVTLLLALVSVFILNPMTAEATEFKDVNVTVMDDLREFDQKAELTWQCDWTLSKKGEKKQTQYAKFTLTEPCIVRIELTLKDQDAFAANNVFYLYGNSSMAKPIVTNDASYGSGSAYCQLEAGTYYMECSSEIYMDQTSNHSTKIVMGAVPVTKAVEVTQVVNVKEKKVTITAEQKMSTKVGKVKWCKEKVDKMDWSATELDADDSGKVSFDVKENGWYTVEFVTDGTDSDIYYREYFYVDGIKTPATKGKTYTKSNVKYKVTKNDSSKATGTVTVMGMKSHKSSVTIPATVKINDYVYTINKIEKKAFYKKSKLKTVTIKATGITSFGKDSFKGINKKATIYVPKAKYKTYSSKLKKVGVKSPMKIKKK